MVRPLAQFCCGCSLSFGAKVILTLNLLLNLFYIITAICNIILRIPAFGYGTSLTTQTFFGAWCLMGLPFIFSGFWGVLGNLEGHVRLYLFYQVGSFTLDMAYIIASLVMTDVCTSMPSALAQHGSAFACGFMRLFASGSVILVICFEMYFVLAIWSFCEDLRASGGMYLADLLHGSDHRRVENFRMAYSDTLFHGAKERNYPAMYRGFASPGMGGSTNIYGSFHETKFPPPA